MNTGIVLFIGVEVMVDSNEKTKLKIAYSLKNRMQTNSLSKISIKDIVNDCGLTRQTFYRHFKDKYDCVNWYFERVAQQSFKQLSNGVNLNDGLIKKFELLKADQRFFYEAFMADDKNSLFQYDYDCIYEFYSSIILKKVGALDTEMEFLLKMYCKGSIDMTFEWVKEGMKLSEKEFAHLLIEAMPISLKKYLLVFD